MPGGGGEAIWTKLSAAEPELAERIVFVTGDAANDRAQAFVGRTGRKLVWKPFRIEQIREALELGRRAEA